MKKHEVVIVLMAIVIIGLIFVVLDLDTKYNNCKAELKLYNVVYEEIDDNHDIVRMKPLIFDRKSGSYLSTMVYEEIEFPLYRDEFNKIKYVLY